MVISEFIEETSVLENYFDKDYTSEQRKIMFDNLKNYSVKEYRKGIKYCINNCKYLPKIVDIRAGLSQIDPVKNKEKIKIVPCTNPNCNDGFVRYFKKVKDGQRELKFEYLALCTCENGKNQKAIMGYDLPFITEIGLDS